MPSAVVLLEPVGHLLVAADQRRAGTAADQADAGPQVGGDLEVVRVGERRAAAVQRAHPLLPDRLAGGERRLGLSIVARVEAVEQPLGLLPGLARWCRGRGCGSAGRSGRCGPASLARPRIQVDLLRTCSGGSPQVR